MESHSRQLELKIKNYADQSESTLSFLSDSQFSIVLIMSQSEMFDLSLCAVYCAAPVVFFCPLHLPHYFDVSLMACYARTHTQIHTHALCLFAGVTVMGL